MIRLRRASAIVAVSLLISTATAHAECAWVLWENIIQDAGFRTEVVPQTAGMRPMRAYNNKPDCDRALADALAAFKSSPGRVVTRDPQSQEALVTMENRSTLTYRYACLPDTVDLRGPKGK